MNLIVFASGPKVPDVYGQPYNAKLPIRLQFFDLDVIFCFVGHYNAMYLKYRRIMQYINLLGKY